MPEERCVAMCLRAYGITRFISATRALALRPGWVLPNISVNRDANTPPIKARGMGKNRSIRTNEKIPTMRLIPIKSAA